MNRKNYVFDSSALFAYLPSIWGKNYADRPVFEKLYSIFARVAEAEYASVFQVDDAKDLSTVPVSTYYPVVYEKFENWQSYGTEHAHTRLEFAIDTLEQVTKSGEQYYVIRVPDIYLRGDVQLFVDSVLIPSTCYLLDASPYMEWYGSPAVPTEVDGSTVFLSVNRLAEVFGGSPVPDALTIYTLKTSKPFRFVADGTTAEYALTGFDEATRLVAEDTHVFLESIEADSFFTYTSTISGSTETRVYTVKPVNAAGLSKGATFRIYFSEGNDLYIKKVQLSANRSSFTVAFNAGASVIGVQMLINFELGRHMVDLYDSGLTLKGSNTFFPGARVRITDDTGVQSFTLDRIQTELKFDRIVDVDTVSISFLGVNILESGALEGSIKFDGVPTAGVHVLVDASIANEHVHAHEQVVVEADSPSTTNTVTLPLEAPMVIDPLSADLRSEFFPLRVFLDGQIVSADSYTILDSVTIEFNDYLDNGVVVDLHYLNQEELIRHRHVVLNQTVPADVPIQYAFEFDAAIDTAYYLESYVDGLNYQDTAGLYVKNSSFANFRDGIPAGGRVALYGTTKSFKYWHVLEDRTEAQYQYKGSLLRADWLQDGIDTPEHAMAWGSNFTITVEGDTRIVQATYAPEDGWFLEAQVDERTAQVVWGEVAGLVRESSETYNKVLAAAYAGYRSGSYVSALENFASILLGSEYLPATGTSRGIVNVNNGVAADIELLDLTRVQLPLDANEPDRLLAAPQAMPRFHAINKYATVVDKDLSAIPYLVWMSEEVSNFRFSKRLDSQASDVTTGLPYSYDAFSAILTDYSLDFSKEEVHVGDLIKVSLDASAGSATRTQFTHVLEVLDSHRIRVPITLTPTQSGYGDGPFGGGVIGGGVSIPRITGYTIWTRKTRPLDVFLRLDEALDKLQTSVAGETIQTLNLNIADILKHFCFAVKIAWSRMTDIERLEDLQRFINIFKPAHTKAFVYTEFLDGELSEELTIDILDYDIDLSVAGTHEADSWRADASYFSDSFVAYSSELTLLYYPELYSIGPKIAEQIKRAPENPTNGQYYLIGEVASMGDGSSGGATILNPFYRTFSTEHGFENLVVKAAKTGSVVEYHVNSGFGDRIGQGLRLTTDKRIRVPNWSYVSGSDVSFSSWVKIETDDPLFAEPLLFQVANPADVAAPYFTVAITLVAPGEYEVSAQGSTTLPSAVSSELISSGSWVFIAAVFKVVDVSGDSVFTPYIYVNGVEDVADMTAIDPSATTVPNLTTDVFIGAGLGSAVGVQAENSLDCTVDETIIWSKALTATEVITQYNSGAGLFSRPMGVSTDTSTGNVSILHEDGVDLVFHYEKDMDSETVFDDSGNGYNGLKEGGDVLSRWATTGIVAGPQSQGQDVHEIDEHGTYIHPGDFEIRTVAFDQSTGDDIPVYNYDLLVSSVFISNQGTERLTKPNIVFTLDVDQGTWKRMSMVTPAISSCVTLNTEINPYSGFSGGGLVDPDGNTTGQL
jgi:hypothetical protein